MFLRDKAIRVDDPCGYDMTPLILREFHAFLDDHGLLAGFLCEWDEENQDASIVCADGLPDAPFKTTKHDSLVAVLKDCLVKYPAPHVHMIADSDFWVSLSSVTDTEGWQRRALFLPACCPETDVIMLCFSRSTQPLETNPTVEQSAREFVRLVGFLLSSHHLNNRIRIMEIYAREIGHDIASSVQAVVSKLRNVARGLVNGQLALDKIREAEEEVMAAYRTADTLGITVDPDYNIGSGDDFSPADCVRQVLSLCRSEAQERHVELRTELPSVPMTLWGDQKAIQSALTQLVLNAIKYAKGSSHITVRVAQKNGDVEFSVTDLGKSLEEEEKAHMWEFGWRGRRAKELHVNGSGIGLYTVRKVVRAHGGNCGAIESPRSKELVTFYMRLPKRDILRKTELL